MELRVTDHVWSIGEFNYTLPGQNPFLERRPRTREKWRVLLKISLTGI